MTNRLLVMVRNNSPLYQPHQSQPSKKTSFEMVSALLLLAQGTEESEFVITYDVLVRASIRVSSALVGSSSTSSTPESPHSDAYVTCSRGVKIVPDLRLPDLAGGKALEYDAIVVPGGAKGAETIAANPDVQELLAAAYAKGKVVAAICAGSLALKHAGVGKDGALTSHPSVKVELDKGMSIAVPSFLFGLGKYHRMRRREERNDY